MWKFKKFLIWLSICAFILLPACNAGNDPIQSSSIENVIEKDSPYIIQSGQGVDGYRVVHSDFVQVDIALKIHMYRSHEDFEEQQKKFKVANPVGGRVAAFTHYDYKSNRCDIYMLDPAFVYEPEIIGHELVHCIYGDFHKGQVIAEYKE